MLLGNSQTGQEVLFQSSEHLGRPFTDYDMFLGGFKASYKTFPQI